MTDEDTAPLFTRPAMRTHYRRGRKTGLILGLWWGVSASLLVYIALNAPPWYLIFVIAMMAVGAYYGWKDS